MFVIRDISLCQTFNDESSNDFIWSTRIRNIYWYIKRNIKRLLDADMGRSRDNGFNDKSAVIGLLAPRKSIFCQLSYCSCNIATFSHITDGVEFWSTVLPDWSMLPITNGPMHWGFFTNRLRVWKKYKRWLDRKLSYAQQFTISSCLMPYLDWTWFSIRSEGFCGCWSWNGFLNTVTSSFHMFQMVQLSQF